MNAQPLIDWVRERRTGAAITVIGVVFVIGLIGWWLTAPELGFLSILCNTLTLFALNFGHEGPIHPLLEERASSAGQGPSCRLIGYGGAVGLTSESATRPCVKLPLGDAGGRR